MARTGRAFPVAPNIGQRQALEAASGGATTNTNTVPVTAALAVTPFRTVPASAALLTTPTNTVPSTAALLTSSTNTVPLTVAISIAGKASGSTTTGTGTGAATMAADTTHSVSWTASSGGAGSGTETDIVSANASGDGWAYGSLPAYGGMPFSAWYERAASAVVNAAMNSVNPGSQGSMGTSISDGVGIHVQYSINNGVTFHGSEDIQSWTKSELAPTQTGVRRRLQASGTDANGLAWTIVATVYPGDPGLVFYKVSATNSSGGTITPTGSGTSGFILASPAGLLSSTASGADQGPWVADSSHARKGTVSTLTASAAPTSATSGEPDLLAALPASGIGTLATQRLGIATVKFTKMADAGLFSASAPFHVADQNTTRTKLYWMCTAGAIANGATGTWYLLQVLRGSATDADLLALAADYMQPGTPTVATGTLTTFNYTNHTAFPFNLDEGCYEVAAAANAADLTLDFGVGTQANIRYKPRWKVTGLSALSRADGSECHLTWGGAVLVSGTDYNIAVDTATGTAYVALQFDVVFSGAGTGQKNSAALAMTAAPFRVVPASAALLTTSIRTVASTAALLTTSTRTVPDSAALLTSPTRTVAATGALLTTNTRTIPGTGALLTTQARTIPGTTALLTTPTNTIPATGALSATSTRTVTATAALSVQGTNTNTVPATAALLTSPTRTVPASVAMLTSASRTIPGSAALLTTSTRTVAATAALTLTGGTNTIPATGVLLTIRTRTVPLHAVLSGVAPASRVMRGTIVRRPPITGSIVRRE